MYKGLIIAKKNNTVYIHFGSSERLYTKYLINFFFSSSRLQDRVMEHIMMLSYPIDNVPYVSSNRPK